MLQNERHIGVDVVVFELEIMRFLFAVRDVIRQGAVAKCAGEEVALTGWLSIQIARQLPNENFFGGCRIGAGDEDRAKDEKQDLKRRHDDTRQVSDNHCLLRVICHNFHACISRSIVHSNIARGLVEFLLYPN